MEVDGMVMDPLKAMHKVRGVSAREMCHYFFNPRYRYEWESEFLIYSYSVFPNTFTLFTNVTLKIKTTFNTGWKTQRSFYGNII